MELVNVQEAKTHLSRLLDEAIAGQEIVIAKSGKPQVRLVPCLTETSPRKLGAPAWSAPGKVWIAEDFDEVDERIVELFEGKSGKAPRARKPARAQSRR